MPGLSGRSMGLTHFDFKCSLFGKSTEVLCLKIITPHQNICTQCLYTNICTFEHLYTNEVTEDVYTSRKKQHQTMMHYFCALNTLQYKKKIALLEPLLGYMQAQVNNVLCFGL